MPMDMLLAFLPRADQAFLAYLSTCRPVPNAQNPNPSIPNPKGLADHLERILADWEPHVLSEEERVVMNREGVRYLDIVRQIEQHQRSLEEGKHLKIETRAQMLFARQNYWLRYFRTFRVNDLPTEIMSNIIRFVIWDSMKRPVNARLWITSTCRRWRDIALHDSTLWNAIWFRGITDTERPFEWFERSRQASLDIRIDCSSPKDPGLPDDEPLTLDEVPTETADQMRVVLTRLFTKLSQIRMLIVVVNDWRSALVVLELLHAQGPSGVPLLQRFELHRSGHQNENRLSLVWPKVTALPFLGGIQPPSLTYVSLNGMPVVWEQSVFKNLTTLDIRRLPVTFSPTLAKFRGILQSCPLLQKLSLDGAGPQYEETGFIVPVHLAHLRTLVIADFTRAYVQFLVAQISAPNVNDLTLMNLCGDDYLPFFMQITSAFPKVRVLTTYSIQFDPSGGFDMMRWLDSMPLLAYLRVANVANQFFGLFFQSYTDKYQVVAPNLVTLDCQSIDTAVLIHFVKDRLKLNAPLEKIYVSEDLGSRLTVEQVKELTSICVLAKLPRGATTPEEERLSHDLIKAERTGTAPEVESDVVG